MLFLTERHPSFLAPSAHYMTTGAMSITTVFPVAVFSKVKATCSTTSTPSCMRMLLCSARAGSVTRCSSAELHLFYTSNPERVRPLSRVTRSTVLLHSATTNTVSRTELPCPHIARARHSGVDDEVRVEQVKVQVLPMPPPVLHARRTQRTPREPCARGEDVPLPARLFRVQHGDLDAERVVPARRERDVQHPQVQ